jgi:hypothetical protein
MVGVVVSVLLTFAVVLVLMWIYDPANFSYPMSGVIRFAPLCFLLWLAWGDIKNIPWWHWLVMLAVLLICAIKPVFWFAGIPIMGYILFAWHKR